MRNQKKVIINGRFLSSPHITGVQRYAFEVLYALDSLISNSSFDEDLLFLIISPQNVKHKLDLKNIEHLACGFLVGHAWEQIELPIFVKDNFLLNLCNLGPIAISNQAIVFHDVLTFAFPSAYAFGFKIWYRFVQKILSKRVRSIITVSKFSKSEIVKYLHVNADKVIVIYEGCDHIRKLESSSRILLHHSLIPKKYILAVSSINPNKNFSSIIKSIELLKSRNLLTINVVLVGSISSTIYSSSKLLLDNVKYLGYLTDEELKALYENALIFIYPSFYEGFGLPPLEAMSLECATIVSNISVLSEICGDASLYCDPYSIEDIASKILFLLENPSALESYISKGKERSSLFTWKDTALNLCQHLKSIV